MVGRWGGDLGRRGIWEQFGTTKQTPKSHLLQMSQSRHGGKEASWLTDVEEEKLVDRKANGDKGTSKGRRTGQWGFIPALHVKQ